ncbi:Fic/DOC family protein [Lachnoanaerobaculum umeaense]|jgi:cell filamentation protein fic, putative|uniref:protein adenylyltransferase n=1 Tax=Lachnoanaerobaculum umeaense TaxID=617123 RepID=A0A385PZZ9_9FIRM|nr:Fic family protein [Lachnoanaerobaculum umeaense]AYA98867.1 cell filamentation protein Fic [Lachnoanaerobaculum umeaense]PZW94919.1 cell filamentation protein [Lachnoanaerobaculum umeaense]
MPDKKYCYKDSDILINKFDIRDVKKLKLAERKLTMLRLLELFDDPIEGRFDLAHLQNIHRYIFQDIYEWSGEIRTIDIAKEHMFCNAKFIRPQADEIFLKLKKESYLGKLDNDGFIKRLAYYLGEINALHPFREGNGRSQREFIRALALRNGYVIHYDRITPKEMISASIKSFMCNYCEMEELIKKCIEIKL